MRTTTEEFDKRVAESGVKAIRLSEYISNSKKVKFVCPVHNIKFELFDDAVKARKDAEKKYFGEFAYNPDAPRIEVS